MSLVGSLRGVQANPELCNSNSNSFVAMQGNDLTAEQIASCEKHGILIDKDDQGILLQIFTKPLGDRCALLLGG